MTFEQFVRFCASKAAAVNAGLVREMASGAGFGGDDCVSAMVRYAFERGPRPHVPGTPIPGEDFMWADNERGTSFPTGVDEFNACGLILRWAIEASLPDDVMLRLREVVTEFAGWVLRGVNRHGERRNLWSYRATVYA